ncbi:MAG: hypothetical protein H6719_20235 [Sandaracinaceae bacterium]|nr:hypothetical protein [Sandaracinaceae bacterium]
MRTSIGLLIVLLGHGCGGTSEPTESERVEERLDRTAVHFHLALRDQLEGPSAEQTAAQLVASRGSPARARDLAERVYAERQRGARWLREGRRPARALAPLVAEGADADAASDQAAFFLALLLEDATDDTRIPKQILVYESTRLSPERVRDSAVRALARAGRALVLARAGYCEMAEAEALAALEAGPSRAEVEVSTSRWLATSALDSSALHADLTRALSVLSGAARACCRIRDGRHDAAARSIQRWIGDAEELGVSRERIAILRGWSALALGDADGARVQLGLLRSSAVEPAEAPRQAMLRDALASASDDALDEATHRLVDRPWLSGLALRGVHRAFAADGLLAALDEQREARAHRDLAIGHGAVIASARARFPMFDQAHQGDQGSLERIQQLFR